MAKWGHLVIYNYAIPCLGTELKKGKTNFSKLPSTFRISDLNLEIIFVTKSGFIITKFSKLGKKCKRKALDVKNRPTTLRNAALLRS